MTTFLQIRKFIGCTSFYMWLGVVVLALPIYWEALNLLGPSSNYYVGEVEGAARTPDGHFEAFLGQKIWVHYEIVRHAINGDCYLRIFRYGENVGGPEAGKRHLLDYSTRRFRGTGERLKLRWPQGGLVLDYGKKFDADSASGEKLLVDESDPLIPPGQDAQELALYVVARYDCNPMDWVFPRYIQGGPVSNQTQRVYLIVRRR